MVISDTRLCREFAPTLAHLCESMGRLPLNWRGVVTVNAYAALDLVYGVETSDPIRILCDMILSNYFGILVVTLSYMIMIFQFIVSCVRALKQENSSSLMLTQTEDSDNEKWYEDLIRMLVKFEFFLAGFSITFVLLYFWFESNSLFANVPMISNHYFALYILVYVFVSTSTLLILCRVYFVEEWISSRGQVPIILACYNLISRSSNDYCGRNDQLCRDFNAVHVFSVI
ncbi:hypothetical protein M3Y98_00116100 [Aphelenchoides besseyi]|nr:hypothetical protein M3Y98_00116100 [Aphelenchoides besseyi]KAI6199458.1 hypothetical protein M3Y96_00629200 [Aphelenchoides besseyi]